MAAGRQGKFPKPVKIGSNKNGWVEDEINDYIASRIAARDGEQQPKPKAPETTIALHRAKRAR